MQINPYLNFNGNCEAAFNLYERVLGGKIVFKMTHGESPMAASVGPDWQNKIMHASLAIGDRIIQGSDLPPQHYSKPGGYRVAIDTKDPAEAERVFSALSEGGSVQMPLQETFWAPRFGMFTDQFGTPWMINCENPV